MSKIKICVVCGKEYEYCGHCDKNAQENNWKKKYCSKDCSDVFDIVSKYAYKHISIEDAKNELIGKTINTKAGSNIAKFCEEIMSYAEEQNNEEVSESVDALVEEVPMEEEKETNSFVETESKFKRRRRHISKSDNK